MYDMLIETMVVTFVMGGLLGAITALHLSSPSKEKAPIRSKRRNQQ